MSNPKPFKFTPASFLFFLLICVCVGWFIGKSLRKSPSSSNNTTKSTSSNYSSSSCVGTESCINKVRENFNNTGKQILSEEYLDNGRFGISFLDARRGETYNARVTTDCNCNLIDVNVSIMR
jgi:hypothetical protein